MDPTIEADVALIREVLGPDATDDEAAALAIQTLADHIRQGRVVMTAADLQHAMVRYATHALSVYVGEEVRPVDMGDGTIGFERTGAPVPAPPPMH